LDMDGSGCSSVLQVLHPYWDSAILHKIGVCGKIGEFEIFALSEEMREGAFRKR